MSARKYATGSRQVWRYRHADFDKACCLLEKVNWVTELADCSDVNDAVNVFHSHFLHVMSLSIPKGSIRENRYAPWLSKDIVDRGVQ